jgi:predicted transcriptional regulator
MADEPPETETSEADILACSATIVAAFVGRNPVGVGALPDLIRTVHGSLRRLSGTPLQVPHERQKPAVPVSRSVQREYIVCLEDGAQLKMLKRYLRTRFDLSPEDYRRKWSLPPDYPMVAPAYAERRSDFAKRIGLGKGVRRRS